MSLDEKKATVGKQKGQRKPSQSTHVYHYNVGTEYNPKPLCKQRGAALFTNDIEVFLDYSTALQKGLISICTRCQRILRE